MSLNNVYHVGFFGASTSVRAPNFHYTTPEPFLSIGNLHKFLKILFPFLYLTFKKIFVIILLQGKGKEIKNDYHFNYYCHNNYLFWFFYDYSFWIFTNFTLSGWRKTLLWRIICNIFFSSLSSYFRIFKIYFTKLLTNKKSYGIIIT